MARLLIIATIGIPLLALGAGKGPTLRLSADEQNAGPCLVIWRTASRLGPSPPKQQHADEGLEVAVWTDATILLSPRRCALGQHMLVGKVGPADVRAALASIKEARFQKLNRDWVVPDSGYATIVVRDTGVSTKHSWHEYLLPGFGGDISTDADYREFVRSWKKTRAAIEGLAPLELRTLQDTGDFRGYVVDAPEKTTWRPH